VVHLVLVEMDVKPLLLLGIAFVPIKDHVMGLLVSVRTSVTVIRTAVLRNVLVSSVLEKKLFLNFYFFLKQLTVYVNHCALVLMSVVLLMVDVVLQPVFL